MKTIIAVIASTIYLFLFTALHFINVSITLCAVMYLLSPFVVIYTVYLVLTDKDYKYPELKDGDEWGYRDKKKSDLGIF
jgi:hypothetical protein